MTTAAAPVTTAPARDYVRKLLPTALISASALLLFGIQTPFGYPTLAAGLLVAMAVDRELLKHLALIAAGLLIISTVPLHADLSIGHMVAMGTALALAVAVPYAIHRWVYRERIIRFPMFTGKKWSLLAKLYLLGVVLLGYLILPVYLISTEVYENWPDASSDPTIFWRLFLGVNAVGIWDELFFICTVFTLLIRHFPVWIANLLTAVMFSSFLWEIGYEAWGPLLTFPFALLQGYTFRLTKSFTYVVSVHLLFDLVLFLALVHAHDRSFLPVFLY
ncbi:CPBP family intramembrane metalloprotease [Salinibacterium sp. SYSU T00001]|uniref:CPBP family glutamic-type intramembrane protease n=1 Tax=Homoserinimonas sedimenticola TaxID=2986805 RepID=UPI0022360FD6|nr:CPBP family intramembrane glutamic endopeptidase [Salinibacterium sedimenticola]MCW4384245.1 CPBP family intramembrane metalloprotease [Salinibacterium sedimenticola]